MLNAFSDLLCLKLCWHNRLVPNYKVCTHVSYMLQSYTNSSLDLSYLSAVVQVLPVDGNPSSLMFCLRRRTSNE